ncbi:S-layer homology domain-containing protein [Sedimentibacter sp.]|uniref:S-layer homology domain-containing protein n=1 Tax=Sedimentibacter sp. TaxID=1960295 RepID=UPI0028B0756B|nr:S-layer homology domain-containing protein [Sedimentibacter sp.]
MKQARKRISLILAICMLISMMPVTAYAGGEDSEELPVVNVSNEWELINALQSTTPSAITLNGSIELKSKVTMGEDHTLVIPEGDKLDIIDAGHHDIGEIEVNGNTLNINGGGTVNIKKSDLDGDGISDSSNYFDDEPIGTLVLENITVNIDNTSNYGGLSYINVTVDSDAVINLKSENTESQIHIGYGQTLSINSGGTVNINNFYYYGIYNYGTILINGGELNINEDSGDNEGIHNGYEGKLELRSGTLKAENGGSIYLDEGVIVKGMQGKFSDRGKVIKSEYVTVEWHEDAPEDGLTRGVYVWNGTVFSKEGINITDKSPYYITITEGSDYKLFVEAVATNSSDVKYQWYRYENYNAVIIADETDNTYTIPDLPAGDHKFRCDLSADGVLYTENEYFDVRVIPEGYYGLTVGGVEVTESNRNDITGGKIISGKVGYNPENNTLTLDDAKIAVFDNPTYEDYIGTAIDMYGGIENLTIELKGSSQIGNKPADQGEYIDYTVHYGIFSYNKITVQGSGSLTIYDEAQGISAKDITIDTKGTITIIEHGGDSACCLKADGGTLEIKNGTLNLSSLVSNGLYGDKIKISGGTITAESFDEWDVGLYAFNTTPTFASGYKYKIYAGEDKASAKEVTNPTAVTFTTSKYVKIVPDTSGGGKDDDDDNDGSSGGSKDKDTSAPVTPTVPTPPAETAKKPVEQILNDVGTHWALNSIQFVYDRGIMTGTSSEQFSPDARMSRGMLITALGRLAGINALDFTSGSFNDVDMSSYYGPYAEWSLRSNITRGTGSNSFSPDSPVTREELAVILVNFASAMRYYLPSGEGAQSFADNSNISPWAIEAIEIMRNTSIMQGDPGNNFNPKAPATRAEIAAVLQRFIEYMGL